MIRPLTKRRVSGELYQRPPEVEAAIGAVLALERSELLRRARILDPNNNDFVRPECLVYAIRSAQADADSELTNAMLGILLERCSAILTATIPNAQSQRGWDIRAQVLDQLVDKFLSDAKPGALDMFEVRFGAAFRALKIDVFRARTKEETSLVSVEEPEDEDQPTALPAEPATQEVRLALEQAIWRLPQDARRAYTLVYKLGYEIESNDPSKKTAATICGVSGRTIRTRLNEATTQVRKDLEGK